ncbi:MAG: aminotransferase class III-fold pyridoxal phosphate-dependent enzyme [Calditrichia bacterium]
MIQIAAESFEAITDEHAKQLAEEVFGISGKIQPLDSYDDRTFCIRSENRAPAILKISNPDTPLWEIRGQNTLLLRLAKAKHPFTYPEVLFSLDGEQIVHLKLSDGQLVYLRLLTFLQGRFLSDLDDLSPLAGDIGSALGILDRELLDFYHPGLNRTLDWDIIHCHKHRHLLSYVQDTELRRTIDHFLLQFEVNVLPELDKMPKSVVHNDAHADNILITAQGEPLGLVGLIDYGDTVYTATVCNLAISLTYSVFRQQDPLLVAEDMVRGYHKERPLSEREVDALYYLVAARLCVSLLMCLKKQGEGNTSDYVATSFDNARVLLMQLLEMNPLAAKRRLRAACGMSAPLSTPQEELLKKRKKKIGRNLSVAYSRPLTIVRGAMQYLLDDVGDTYLDCVNNVCHVGHAHPQIVRQVQKQMATLNTNTRYLHEHILTYADRLTATMPDKLSVCFFVNSGSEANDLALRMARIHTGRKDVLVLDGAYHGHTNSILELSPYKYEGRGGAGKVPTTHQLDMPDTYRGKYRASHSDPTAAYLADADAVIKNMTAADQAPAALFAESLLGCGGQVVLPEGYLKGAFELLRKNGGVGVADEVQVGFGRVGSHFWGFDMQSAQPDVVTLGKPIGNGHPLAAVVTTPEIADSFANGMEYFNTFGGNPVSCLIGMTVLDIIEKEGLQQHAFEVGNYLKERLLELEHPLIGDVRGSGLFIGMELVRDKNTLEPATSEAAAVKNEMRENYILISTDGPFDNVIKLKPPLVFSRGNADRLVNALKDVLKKI